MSSAISQANKQNAGSPANNLEGSIDNGIEVVSYRVPSGAAAFTTVGIDGQRYDDGNDSEAEGNPELLKWTRSVTRADGTKAIAINFAFANNFSAPGINKGRAKTLIKKAFQTWAQHAPLDFYELKYNSKQPNSDIDILIEGKSLDGPGRTLAEAFFPKVGGITFDTDDIWSDGKFLETGLHEIGHALGLDHEDDVDAILNSRIANRFTNTDKPYLLEDDIAGIQDLYGVGIGSVTTLGGQRQVILPPVIPPVIPTEEATDGSTDDDSTPPTLPELAPELGPELIENGSFEDAPVAEQDFGLYSRIIGWRATAGIGFRIDKRTEFIREAAEGTAWAAPDILGQNATMAQNVDTLTGQAYKLSVDYSNGGAEAITTGIDVYWEGEKVDSLTGGGQGQWESFAFEVAGGDRDVSTLAFKATGPADSISGLIDNISVRAIQTPTLPTNDGLDQTMALGSTLGTTTAQTTPNFPSADGSSGNGSALNQGLGTSSGPLSSMANLS
ncbi:MAG: matrixin family metalloprotease [Cyanobacteria bacterium J06598_3]